MVTADIQTTGEVYLDGTRFAIDGRVQRTRITEPSLFRTTDVDQAAHPRASVVKWGDPRGGIGIDVMEESQDITRSWFSTCSLRHKGHVVLQRLANQTAAGAIGGGVELLAEVNNRMYAVHSTSVLEYDNTGDSWSTVRETTSPATDAISVPLGGTSTLVIARTTGVDYSTDGTTWSQEETDVTHLTWWRNLLWGISSTGALRFTSDLSAGWTTVTTFTPQLGNVTDLFVGPGRTEDEIIYAAANDGLYFYDNENERFVKTKLAVPYHPNNGKGCIAWRNSVYFPAGLAIYRYTPGEVNVVDLVGPDRDDGLPEVNRGVIQKLVTTHNDLIAVIGPTSQSRTVGAQAFRGATAGPSGHRGRFSGAVTTASGDAVKGLVLGWNQYGWEVKWQDDSAQGTMQAALVSNAYGVYRLWWAAGARVYWMEIPVDIVNPNRVSTTTFSSSGVWETPWFTADILDFDKTALAVHIDSVHPTSSDTIELQYALNYADSSSGDFTTIATKSATGDVEYFLPSGSTGGSSTDQSGIAFESFKLRANLVRGDTTTNSPDIKSIGLVYKKRVEPLYGFTFNVNMRDGAQGRTSQELRSLLEGLAENKNLVRFGYSGENDSAEDFWVEVASVTTLDGTGYDGSDLAQVVVAEAH